MDNKERIVVKDWKLYKLNLIIDKTVKDIHHIMWLKNRNKYNTNIEQNKTKISRREHVALNQFFQDKQSPREQFQKVFDIVKQVLSPWVRKELYTILFECDDDMFYIPELLKWRKTKSEKDLKKSQESLWKFSEKNTEQT